MTAPTILRPDSDFCQRWDDRQHSWRHPDQGGFDRRRYDVQPLDELSAKRYVEQHHYSGRYPASRLRYGLFEGSDLVGVAVLSIPVQQSVLTNAFPQLQPYLESLELGRFVLADRVPANGESWFLGRLFKLAERDGVRGIVSFSDPLPRTDEQGRIVFPGHIGTIYQATNAAYAGRATPRTLSYLPRTGVVVSDRAKQKIRSQQRGHVYAEQQLVDAGATPRRPDEEPSAWLAQALKDAQVQTVRHPGNHRYLFTLGAARKQIAVPRLPYPKKVA